MAPTDHRGEKPGPALLGALLAAALVSGCAGTLREVDAPASERVLGENRSLVSVSGREGATQRFLVVRPRRARASVVLFAGDTGRLDLGDNGSIGNLAGNFLVRSRNRFVQKGLTVALVDTPSDRTTLDGFRTSRAHAVDIRAVIRWLRSRDGVPVWLVGTSRGTISAAAVAADLESGGPDGIVLTATLFGPSARGSVHQARLGAIAVPVLVVHHRADGCSVTPYRKAPAFMRTLSGARRTELITVEGGLGTFGDPCEARSPHGFLGLEDRVVTAIVDWIEAD